MSCGAILLDGCSQRLVGRDRCCPADRGRPASSASDSIASMAGCICSWPNITAPSMTSSDSTSASDSTMSTASLVPATTRSSCDSLSSLTVGFSKYWPSLIADSRAADRAQERQSRQRQRRRRAEHRRDVRIDLRVHRQHRRDHLDVALKAVREQRPDRPIDEPRRQRLLLARAPFALEEAARDAARGIGLLLVVDGERKEVASVDVLLLADGRDEHDGVGHIDDDGAVGLARDRRPFRS